MNTFSKRDMAGAGMASDDKPVMVLVAARKKPPIICHASPERRLMIASEGDRTDW